MIFDNRRVAAAVRSDDDFYAALKSDVEVIFLQNSNILNIKHSHSYFTSFVQIVRS